MSGLGALAWAGETVQAKPTVKWESIRANWEVSVNIRQEEFRSKVVVPIGTSVQIIPNPDDQWASTARNADPTPANWEGNANALAGWSKKLQVMVYPQSGVLNGQAKPDPKNPWVDVAKLPGGKWTGPGELIFRGELQERGSAKGMIRVKILKIVGEKTDKPEKSHKIDKK